MMLDMLMESVTLASATAATPVTQWWSTRDAGILGAIGGSVGGLLGAGLGCAVPLLANRGRARGAVLGVQVAAVLLGVALLALGVAALALGQPYHVWQPPLLIGTVMGGVMGGLLPVTLGAYRRAEALRLEAEQLRREG
jgi:MFS family permease